MRPIVISLLLLAMSLLPGWSARAVASHYVVPVESGPIGSSVTSLLQDGDGYMWVGTISGLMRYDMYSYRYFGDCDGVALSHTMTRSLSLAPDGAVWIGTEKGAVVYDPRQATFRHIGGRIAKMPVKTVTPTPAGSMMLTVGDGIAIVDPATLSYRFLAGSAGKSFLNNILVTATDPTGCIWAWSNSTLMRIDFPAPDAAPRISTHRFPYEIRAMAIDPQGRLWFNDRDRLLTMQLPSAGRPHAAPVEIATGLDVRAIRIYGCEAVVTTSYDGIHLFTLSPSGLISPSETVWIDPSAPSEVCNSVVCVERDRSGHYWFGTVDGIHVACKRQREVFHTLSASDPNGLSHNVVADLCPAPDGALWVATSGGLDRLVRTPDGGCSTSRFAPPESSREADPGDRRLQSVLIDSCGLVWLGTKRTLRFFDPATARFVARPDITAPLDRAGARFSKELFLDRKGNVWMGFSYGGLFVYDRKSATSLPVKLAGVNLFDASPQAIIEDSEGRIWVGTKNRGLLRFSPSAARRSASALEVPRFDTFSLTDRVDADFITVNSLHRAHNGTIYVGSSHGLYALAPGAKAFTECRLSPFDRDVWVLNVTSDLDGSLWVSTMQGVYHFTPGADRAPFYRLADGAFARSDYNFGSCRLPDGTIFLGGINGLTSFHPDRVLPPASPGRVHISSVSVLNRELRPDGDRLTADIDRARRLTLHHDDHQVSLDFSTLSFTPDRSVRFFYRIDGLMPEWMPLGEGNRLSLSGLAPGKYLLQVKAADISGSLGDDTTELIIEALPPWWLTWWAYALYALGILLVVAIVVWGYLSRQRAAREVAMVHYKQQLFINMTHGFKTPLTMMQVPLQLLADSSARLAPDDRRRLIAMMKANVNKLANTVRQLMEFRKIDRDKISLNLAEIDLVDFVERICLYFKPLFESKRIAFTCNMPSERIMATLDPEKIELALYNLLQNAYTFTRPEGSVTLTLSVAHGAVSIAVADTGIGISQEHIDKIFNSFYQVYISDHLPPLGAGIGLTIAREFARMHSGNVTVQSSYGHGSTFTLSLPLKADRHLGSGYIHAPNQPDPDDRVRPEYTRQYVETDLFIDEPPAPAHNADSIFVVSGSAEMAPLVRMVLPDLAVSHFNDLKAVLKAVRDSHPQLIVIDIAVYDRDEGLRLIRSLKASKAVSHIPVILLAPDDTPEDARTFCEAGADAWIEKPFDVELFRARVKQLVSRHADLREKLKMGQILGKQDEVVAETADEKFMTRVMEVIERNIPNEEFSLNEFAQEMLVSRSVLNSRIQSIVGKSPMELLRAARMDRAAQLLATNAYDVAQVGYMVGFGDPRYFSTCFRKRFGDSPRTFMQKAREA